MRTARPWIGMRRRPIAWAPRWRPTLRLSRTPPRLRRCSACLCGSRACARRGRQSLCRRGRARSAQDNRPGRGPARRRHVVDPHQHQVGLVRDVAASARATPRRLCTQGSVGSWRDHEEGRAEAHGPTSKGGCLRPCRDVVIIACRGLQHQHIGCHSVHHCITSYARRGVPNICAAAAPPRIVRHGFGGHKSAAAARRQPPNPMALLRALSAAQTLPRCAISPFSCSSGTAAAASRRPSRRWVVGWLRSVAPGTSARRRPLQPLHDAAAKKSHDGQSPIVDGAFTESGMLARVAVKRSGIHPK